MPMKGAGHAGSCGLTALTSTSPGRTARRPTNVHLAPSKDFGCWPDPESLAVGKGSDGKQYLFAGDAGTEDVSVMDLGRALKGEPVVEVAPRITVQSGPFGIAASPNGKLIAVTARETNLEDDNEGNTISIIDVDLAREGKPGAEAARVQVGTDDPKGLARPFAVAWTPDGKQIVVANFRSNNVSIVDVEMAIAKKPGAEVARTSRSTRAATRRSWHGRRRHAAVTGDGHYAVVAGGNNTIKASATNLTGTAFVIDLQKKAQAATVTGVGIDPYGVAVLDKALRGKHDATPRLSDLSCLGRNAGHPAIRKRPFCIEASAFTGSSAFADDDTGEAARVQWIPDGRERIRPISTRAGPPRPSLSPPAAAAPSRRPAPAPWRRKSCR